MSARELERKPVHTRRWLLKRIAGIAGAIALATLPSDSTDNGSADRSGYRQQTDDHILACKEVNPEQITAESKDVVSADELFDKYHTRIWGTGDVLLRIRRAALTEEPIFKVLSGEESNAPTSIESLPGLLSSMGNPRRTLDIVLINGPVVHSLFMTDEQKQGLLWLLEEQRSSERVAYQREVKTHRSFYESEAKYFEEQLQELEKNKANSNIDTTAYQTKKKQLEISLFSSRSHAERLLGDGVKLGIRIEKETLGLFGIKLDIKKDPETGGTNGIIKYYVLLAVKPDFRGKSYDTDHDSFFARSPLQSLASWQSYPRESDFTKMSDPDYPVQSDRIGWGLRHEFAHAANARHPETDLVTLGRIVRANKLLCETGDTSLYYFVFITPEGLIITQNSFLRALG